MTIKKSGNNEALRSYINEWYDEIILWDGLDDAIIGIDDDQERVIYSRRKMVDIFMSNGMTKEDADEWVSFNIEQAYLGEHTPITCNDHMISYAAEKSVRCPAAAKAKYL